MELKLGQSGDDDEMTVRSCLADWKDLFDMFLMRIYARAGNDFMG